MVQIPSSIPPSFSSPIGGGDNINQLARDFRSRYENFEKACGAGPPFHYNKDVKDAAFKLVTFMNFNSKTILNYIKNKTNTDETSLWGKIRDNLTTLANGNPNDPNQDMEDSMQYASYHLVFIDGLLPKTT